VTAEVSAQSLVDFLVHGPRAFNHEINVQRRGSWVAKLRCQPYAGKFGSESRRPVFATLITQPAKLDEARSQRLRNSNQTVSKEFFLSTAVPQSGRQTGHIDDPTYSCGESGGIRERKFGAERMAKGNPLRVLPVPPQLFEIIKPAFDRVWRTARRSPAAALFVAMHLNKVVNHVSHGLKLVGTARSAMQQDQGLTSPLRACPKACSVGLNVLLTDGPFHCPIWISPLLAFAHFHEVDRHGPNLSILFGQAEFIILRLSLSQT
jgi:hypothetical protein